MLNRLRRVSRISVWLGISLVSLTAVAQEGDRKDPKGMTQEDIWKKYDVPPAPVLQPGEALESFTVPDGFRVELVASEPLVGDPVEIEFDADGRLWVVEMRGYMPNADGTNETERVGRIVVLEDKNGDGQMDKQTVFLDDLVMPRALAVLEAGILVAEPPRLYLCKDLDGDLRCDERTLLDDNYAPQNDPALGKKSNPEHASNGLQWAMDNWIYSANHSTRYRYIGGQFEQESTISRLQWGISQDNYGRLFYNSNSDHFRGDLVPQHYLARNQNIMGLSGANVRVNPDQTVWPGRITTGVNRGYRPNVLRPDGTLSRFTGACGTLIYRGSNFPSEFLGDGFVCEPTANLIRRNKVSEQDGVVSATNAYHEAEFLTSTDERFRPVNMVNGPDGCLYIVDMYRGLIQHRLYLTSFLRKQVEERKLYEPIGLGRIYRVVYDGATKRQAPALSDLSSKDLLTELTDPDAWRRDTAQRLLVERRDTAVIGGLRKIASDSSNPLGQIHALWTLDGLGGTDLATVQTALSAVDPKVRVAALRVSEALLPRVGPGNVLNLWKKNAQDVPEVQMQLALSLGQIQGRSTLDALGGILSRNLDHRYVVDAVLSSVYQRELEFVELLLDSKGRFALPGLGVDSIYSKLAGAVYREGDQARVLGLLQMAAAQGENEWIADALLGGVQSVAFNKIQGELKLDGDPIRVSEVPASLDGLAKGESAALRSRARQLLEAFHWPGKEVQAEEEVAALNEDQQALFDAGRDLYLISCGACHQPHGRGQDGLAPPLLNSDWVLGSQERITRIVLHGLQGPIEIQGKKWELAMPGLAVFDDQQLASVLTYVRREWGHTAAPISPEYVASIRAKFGDRIDMWTVEELGE